MTYKRCGGLSHLVFLILFNLVNKKTKKGKEYRGNRVIQCIIAPDTHQGIMDKIQDYDDYNISQEFFPGVGHGIGFLPPDIGDNHHGSITQKSSPGAGHITKIRNENKIHRDCNARTDQCDICTSCGFAW